MSTAPRLSLIVPVLNEAKAVPVFLARVVPILEALSLTWEVLFIDDGSTDDTAEMITQQHAQEARIKLIRFSRNFGKEYALTAGLDMARGQAVVPMDVDLQDPPELLPDMVKKWQEGWQVVLAARTSRADDSRAKRLTARLFYRVMDTLSETSIPANVGDFRLMDRAVVDAIKAMPERTRFMKGIAAWVGFRTTTLTYARPIRAAGVTKFRLRSLWRLALDGMLSFSSLPLKIWTYIGALVSLGAFGYAALLIIKTLLYGTDVPGYASLMVVVLFLGGVQLISLGVLGEYIARIYHETKGRPLYLVAQRVGVHEQNH